MSKVLPKGSFILCTMNKIGSLNPDEIVSESLFNGIYKSKCFKVEYETNYRPLDTETMGIIATFFDAKGNELGKDGIMYRYMGKVEDEFAEWDPEIVPPIDEVPEEYRNYISSLDGFVRTSTDGVELMELISSYLGFGERTEDVLLWLGSKSLSYHGLHRVKVIIGSLECPEFNITEDLVGKIVGDYGFFVFIERILEPKNL